MRSTIRLSSFNSNNNKSTYLKNSSTRSIPLLHIVLLLFAFQSMSLFYQVMGANRCPKLKKHPGLKIKPITQRNPKEPYTSGDLILFDCESNETKQTLKCLDDGHWSDTPICPDPTNHTCPNLEPILNGQLNFTGPYKVGTVVAFKCDNEVFNNNLTNFRKPKELKSNDPTAPIEQSLDGQNKFANLPQTTIINSNLNEVDPIQTTITNINYPTTYPTTTTSTTPRPSMSSQPIPLNGASFLANNNNISGEVNSFLLQQQQSTTSNIRYNLTGYRLLKCLPSSKWNHPQPTCSIVLPEPSSNVSLVLTSVCLILIPVLIFIGIIQIFLRWKKRQQQRERWKQYFTDYKYRHSKTSITFGMRSAHQQSINNNNHDQILRPTTSNSNSNIPITDL